MDRVLRAVARALPGDALFFVNTPARAVALTFDDGPHPDTTPALLDLLRVHGAHATFFLTGARVTAHQPLVARIAAGGHELGNHLWRDEPSVLLPAAEFRRQLRDVTALLAGYGSVRWFRPGSGWYTLRMLADAAGQGLRCVLGTVAVSHRDAPPDRRLAGRLLRRIGPGSIAVLHEGGRERRGVAATTGAVLAELDRRGFRAVTVSELVALGSPAPEGGQPRPAR